MFSRYESGMQYGSHVDDALMDGMRTDVAFTLFLSDPTSYDGGELTIESAAGEETFKLDAGALVAYSATSLHRNPVRCSHEGAAWRCLAPPPGSTATRGTPVSTRRPS